MLSSTRAVGLALALCIALAAGASSAAGAEPAPPPRTLVIILDAVPFATVDELIASRPPDDPLFVGFQKPVPLISSFPSSTSVAMVGLLEPFELPRSPGYEARFFDWEERRVRGGGAISFFKIDFAWRDFFDWSRKGVVRSALGGLRPVRASIARLDNAVEAFLGSGKDPYFVYLETTDLAAHMKGPDELDRIFVRLDEALVRIRERHPETPFRTVIFSDHGVAGDGTRLVNALPAVRQAVRKSGFKMVERLRETDDLVLTPFGLVSSFEAYSEPNRTAEIAAVLATAHGVDLCVYREAGGLRVADGDGRARIDRVGGSSWSYEAESGDPLGYQTVADELARRAGNGASSFPDAWWLEATSGHRYPDALYRISRAFELVENPASVLCSLDPGFMYGLATTEYLARASGSTVRWTHGALLREATLGFLLTDDERFIGGDALRFDRALVPLTRPRKSAAPFPATAEGKDKMPEVRQR